MKVWVVVSMDVNNGSVDCDVELVTSDKKKAEQIRIKLYEEHGLNKYIKIQEMDVE